MANRKSAESTPGFCVDDGAKPRSVRALFTVRAFFGNPPGTPYRPPPLHTSEAPRLATRQCVRGSLRGAAHGGRCVRLGIAAGPSAREPPLIQALIPPRCRRDSARRPSSRVPSQASPSSTTPSPQPAATSWAGSTDRQGPERTTRPLPPHSCREIGRPTPRARSEQDLSRQGTGTCSTAEDRTMFRPGLSPARGRPRSCRCTTISVAVAPRISRSLSPIATAHRPVLAARELMRLHASHSGEFCSEKRRISGLPSSKATDRRGADRQGGRGQARLSECEMMVRPAARDAISAAA